MSKSRTSFMLLTVLALLCSVVSPRLVVNDLPDSVRLPPLPKDETLTIINNLTPADVLNSTRVEFPAEHADTVAYAGYVTLTNSENMHFTFYEAANKNVTNPNTIIWLQGGPGCSSEMGNYFELGPFSIQKASQNSTSGDDTLELVPREYAWNRNNNLIFIDNPIGTGYSFVQNHGNLVTSQEEMAANMYQVLSTLLTQYGLLENDLYITGESYAGKWVPSSAYYILQNHAGELPLKGIIMIDGWSDPRGMVEYYPEYAFNVGLIDLDELDVAERMADKVERDLDRGKNISALFDMSTLWNYIVSKSGNCDIYNHRHYYAEDISLITEWLNLDSTKEMFHVPTSGVWEECNGDVYAMLYNDFMQSIRDKMPYILERIPVLIWNGQDDLIVNHASAQRWLSNIDWPKINGFNRATRKVLVSDQSKQTYAYEKTFNNLTWNLLLKAGHMGPHDQSKYAYCLLERFIGNTDLEDC